MIIKIMKPNGEFWMCDNIDVIEVRRFPGQDTQDYPAHTYKLQEFFGETDKGTTTIQEGVAIQYQDKHGEWCLAVLRNTIGYLCNDNGKTVERICG